MSGRLMGSWRSFMLSYYLYEPSSLVVLMQGFGLCTFPLMRCAAD